MSENEPGSDGGLDLRFFLTWIDRSADAIAAERDRLTRLDAAIGDGDHGTNLHRGFTAVRAAQEAKPPQHPGEVLVQVGTTLLSKVGGASGPLYGTVFRRAGKALGEGDKVSPQELAAALAAGLEGLQKLGGAGVGDKTMVDVFVPAIDTFTSALADAASADSAFDAAAEAAAAASQATIPLRARKGRASYLGERSEGHEDPGAASSALLWRTLAETASSLAR